MKNNITLLLVIVAQCANAQIGILNPGFEGSNQDGVPPTSFITCNPTPDTQPCTPAPWYLDQLQGNTYLGVQAQNGFGREEASILLTCPLVKDVLYTGSLYAYTVLDSVVPFLGQGHLQIYGCLSPCQPLQLLWESPDLTGYWQPYFFSFTANNSYSYLMFTAKNIDNHCYVGVDAMSELTALNYNYLQVTADTDTVQLGSCITLNVFSDDSLATFQWTSIPAGYNSNETSDTVCPTESTAYLCTATFPCGMQLTKSVNVIIHNTSIEAIYQNVLNIYPNPANDVVNIEWVNTNNLEVYDALGRIVYKTSISANGHHLQVNVKNWIKGLYLFKVHSMEGRIVLSKVSIN